MLHHGFFWTAAGLWTAGAADVAAALLRTALTAADAEEHDEQEASEDNQQDRQPVVNNEFNFSIRISDRVPSSINGAEINAVIPPHHLINDQVSPVLKSDFAFSVICSQSGLVDASLLDDGADCTLAVPTVIGWVLTQ